MKKTALFALTFILFLFAPFRAEVSAEEAALIADELEIDLDGLTDSIPESAEDHIYEYGFSPDDPEKITSVTVKDVLGYIWEQFTEKLKYPLKVFIILAGIIIMSSVIESFGAGAADKSLEKIYSMICVLVSAGVIAKPLSVCVSSAAEALYSGGSFMIGYIPVFAGITASSGAVTSAAAYNAIVLIAAEAAVQLASGYIMPVVSMCVALGIIEAVNPDINLTGITEGVSKAVKFALGFIMTVFIGLLSVQSIIGASADTIGVKAAKFLVSNCVPVVGGAVADAYTTLKASLGILRGGTGFFGIAVIFLTVMPSVAEITAMRLSFSAAEILGDILGAKNIKTLMKNASSALSLIFSIIVCFGVMLIISTTLMMLIGLDTV